MQYQHDNYGVKLEVISAAPVEDSGVQVDVELETPEEIDKLMRQPPKHPRQGV